MKQILIWGSILLLLVGCASNKPRGQIQQDNTPELELPFTAPGWLWQIPAGNYAIGITYGDSFYSGGAGDFARDFAAVSLSRNHSSFVVDKQMIISLAMQKEVDWRKQNFNVVVSSDLDYLHEAGKNLVMLDSTQVSGYLIGLFGQKQGKVKGEMLTSDPANRPSWIQNTVYADNNTLFSVGYSHQATLMDAWNLAQELALRQIGQFRLQNVVAEVRATEDEMRRNIAIETVTRSQNVFFDKSFIIPVRKGNTSSYKVYLQLMTAEKP